MRIALIGRPGSGKTTAFNALGGARQKLPGTLQDECPVVSVEVPDSRLQWLAEMYKPKKVTPARMEFADYPGLPKTEEKGKPEVLASIRACDGLALVVRAFETAEYAYEDPKANPLAEARGLLEDLLFGDYAILEKRVEKLRTQVTRPTKTQEQDRRELATLEKVLHEVIEGGKRLNQLELGREEEMLLRGFRFASQKPVLVLWNHSGNAPDVAAVAKELGLSTESVLPLQASVEEEIASLAPEDRELFLAEYGIAQPVRERIIQVAYASIGLCSFLTAGEDEVRAWTISRGDSAVAAAGRIHSDIARGFIRAETIAFDDLRAAGDMRAAKAANKVRLEAKDYVVKDGDIMNFRFSV
jgi:GTP-binding protein YchF